MGTYFDKAPLQVFTGEVVEAADVNNLSAAVEAGFDDLEADTQAGIQKAYEWAEKNEDVEVETGLFSSKHYSLKSAASAVAAETAETNAELAQAAAELAQTGAETAETNAELAQAAAELAQTGAEAAQAAAEAAADVTDRVTILENSADEDRRLDLITGLHNEEFVASRINAIDKQHAPRRGYQEDYFNYDTYNTGIYTRKNKIFHSDDTVKFDLLRQIFNQDAYDALGVPSTLRALSDGVNLTSLTVFIPAADLAAIGIVPDDVTPPTVSCEMSYAKGTTSGSAGFSWYVGLYYDTFDEGAGVDRILYQANITTAYEIGLGDATLDTIVTTINDDLRFGYVREGIPVNATYAGKPFKGMFMQLRRTLAEGGQFDLVRFVCIAGSTLDPTKSYLNYPGDFGVEDREYKRMGLKDVDRLFVIGDSITAGFYNQENKAFVCRLSQLLDAHVETYSSAGGTLLDRVFEFVNNVP